MTFSPSLALTAVVLLTATSTAAAPAPAPSTQVGEVVVPGGPPPKVAASYPADGGSVPAGTLILKIVFDQPMTPDSWSYGKAPDAAFPNCLQRPRLLGDQRTFVLLCTVGAHKSYALQINVPRDFTNERGRSANPILLHFSTTDVGPRDIEDALQLAGLTPADDPIMTWKDPGGGVSQSARPVDADAQP
jgi:hypothetical protein